MSDSLKGQEKDDCLLVPAVMGQTALRETLLNFESCIIDNVSVAVLILQQSKMAY